MSEEWRDVPGFEGAFKVNTNGNIWDVVQNDWVPYVFRSFMGYGKYHSGTGYLCCSLNGKLYNVHRVVAETFIPNPENLPCINHKDEDPTNNAVSNLEWCSYKHNSNWGTLPERRKQWCSKAVVMLDNEGKILRTFQSATDAAETLKSEGTKVDWANILNVCNKRLQKGSDGKYRLRKKAGGYRWEFATQQTNP